MNDSSVDNEQNNITSETIEENDYISTSKNESSKNLKKLFVLLIVIVFGVVAYKYLSKPEFIPLIHIPKEAELMLESPDSHQLDFPSDDLTKIFEFFRYAESNLGFMPFDFKLLGSKWKPMGARIVDYGETKLAVVQFENEIKESDEDFLFYFNFKGDLDMLSLGEAKSVGVKKVYLLDNNNMNSLIFQESKSSVVMFLTNDSKNNLLSLAAKF